MNHPKKNATATLPLVRCAIYTRKSTEEGLEQEFNSLDAQRESAEAFIRTLPSRGATEAERSGHVRHAWQCVAMDA
jgi:hypothetical protein